MRRDAGVDHRDADAGAGVAGRAKPSRPVVPCHTALAPVTLFVMAMSAATGMSAEIWAKAESRASESSSARDSSSATAALQFATDQPTEMAAKPRCLSPVVRLHDDANPFARVAWLEQIARQAWTTLARGDGGPPGQRAEQNHQEHKRASHGYSRSKAVASVPHGSRC